MNVPEELRYTPEHEWVRAGEGEVRVGITDFAQDALGDVVYVELPTVGHTVARATRRRDRVDEVRLRGLRAGSGEIVAVNSDLPTRPSTSMRTRTATGWFCAIAPPAPRQSTPCSAPPSTGS